MRRSFFVQKVLAIFSFVNISYDFSRIRILNRNNVRFESRNSFIEIRRFPGHDPLVYFLNVSFGFLTTTDRESRFDLADLVHYAEPELPLQEVDIKTASRNFPATSDEEIESSLLRMAELLKLYIKLIVGKNFYFVFGEINKEREKINKKILLEEIHSKVNLAFKKENYAEAIKLYKLIETELSSLESMRLEYAKNQLKK